MRTEFLVYLSSNTCPNTYNPLLSMSQEGTLAKIQAGDHDRDEYETAKDWRVYTGNLRRDKFDQR